MEYLVFELPDNSKDSEHNTHLIFWCTLPWFLKIISATGKVIKTYKNNKILDTARSTPSTSGQYHEEINTFNAIEGKQSAGKVTRELGVGVRWGSSKEMLFFFSLAKYEARSLAESKGSDYRNRWWNLGRTRRINSRIFRWRVRKWWESTDWKSVQSMDCQ